MIFELLKLDIPVTDNAFDCIYPEKVKKLTQKHWTSVSIAKMASAFLAEKPGTKVLDIGSGVGKFCLIGATHTQGHFTGIEQRVDLVELSNRLAAYHGINNVKFVHANITSICFSDYDAFYFYNSFYENIDPDNKIDENIVLGLELYHLYTTYLFEQFSALPSGTRLVTQCAPIDSVPASFKLKNSLCDGQLKFWEKV
jgi:SAM-dependent methyltransferase